MNVGRRWFDFLPFEPKRHFFFAKLFFNDFLILITKSPWWDLMISSPGPTGRTWRLDAVGGIYLSYSKFSSTLNVEQLLILMIL